MRRITDRAVLRLDGVAAVTAGLVALAAAPVIGDALSATDTSVRVTGGLLAVLGVDALLVERAPVRWFRRAVLAFVAGRDVALVALLLVGLDDGFGAADVLVAALLAEAVVLGVVEGRPARRSAPLGAPQHA